MQELQNISLERWVSKILLKQAIFILLKTAKWKNQLLESMGGWLDGGMDA